MRRSESELSAKRRDEFPVKLEIVEDGLEEEHGPLNKRSRVLSFLLFLSAYLFSFTAYFIKIAPLACYMFFFSF